MAHWWAWFRRLWRHGDQASPEVRRALTLLQSIDDGGVPLNPVRVNAIARDLGLEVSKQARMEDTIARIRAALSRLGH
ncbi:MAG: hypothetical protein IPJ08_15565 [Burkholderiales bacterium]|nr:hypothetical protein [Burkholderiales bacterium]